MVKRIGVVSAAPGGWLTGGALNPLLRAGYLAALGYQVTLYQPWLTPTDQSRLFPNGLSFASTDQYRQHLLTMLPPAPACASPVIAFYDAWYSPMLRAVYSRGTLGSVVQPCDWLILEEPEHLFLFGGTGNVRQLAPMVTGVLHTASIAHVELAMPSALRWVGRSVAPLLRWYYLQLIKRSCHQCIALSPALALSTEHIVCAVHGVDPSLFCEAPCSISSTDASAESNSRSCATFADGESDAGKRGPPMAAGLAVAAQAAAMVAQFEPVSASASVVLAGVCSTVPTRPQPHLRDVYQTSSTQALAEVETRLPNERREAVVTGSNRFYFFGKLEWYKGFRELVRLMHLAKLTTLDVFGSGTDSVAIERYARQHGMRWRFMGPLRGPQRMVLREYRTFLNASVYEGLCTTTMESLALGRFVIIPRHPSNEFFLSFRNCLAYSNERDFCERVQQSLDSLPAPLSESEQELLNWSGATRRLLEVIHVHRSA